MLSPRKQTKRDTWLESNGGYRRTAFGGLDRADEHIRVPRAPLTSPGVRGLACAMLEMAMVDTRARTRSKSLEDDRISAHAWLASRADGAATFKWCCQILGFSPSAVRSRAARW